MKRFRRNAGRHARRRPVLQARHHRVELCARRVEPPDHPRPRCQSRRHRRRTASAANGASDLGEDHFVPVDPLTTQPDRGDPRTGDLALWLAVDRRRRRAQTNNRIPEALPCRPAASAPRRRSCQGAAADRDRPGRCMSVEARGTRRPASTMASNGGRAARRRQAATSPSMPTSLAARATTTAFRRYPYLVPPDPADAPRATQPRPVQRAAAELRRCAPTAGPWAARISSTAALPASRCTQNNALYHIPGIDGEDHNTRIDATPGPR